MMKIIITGITGFIGKNLMKAIDGDENQYVCLVRKSSNIKELSKADNIKFLTSDFGVSELTQIFQDVEVVIHMAGQIGSYGITWERHSYAKRSEGLQCCRSKTVNLCVNARRYWLWEKA